MSELVKEAPFAKQTVEDFGQKVEGQSTSTVTIRVRSTWLGTMPVEQEQDM